MKLHLDFPVESGLLQSFRNEVVGVAEVTVNDPDPETDTLVSGFPSPEILEKCKGIRRVIIPFAGLQARTREVLLGREEITVYNLHHNASATAEKAVELMMATAKRTVRNDNSMRSGTWAPRFDRSEALQLAGRRAVVLGYGEIGRRVAKVCVAMDMTVTALTRNPERHSTSGIEVRASGSLVSLCAATDVLLVCAPLTPETEGIVNEKALSGMPRHAIVVNIGRGPIIDESALYSALRDGSIFGAGLDVWWSYPSQDEPVPPSQYPFHELPNVVMSPHVGGTVDTSEPARMGALARLVLKIATHDSSLRTVDVQAGY